MREIELSTMAQAGALGLERFEQMQGIRVRHHPIDWATGWNDVLQIGLYQKGPDVSEVGSTWLDNLTDLRALRPFGADEFNALGGADAFIWNGQASDGGQHAWSIPWLLDTRLIHYRRDLLARAGVAEEGAFSTPEALVHTLSRLQAAGIQYPFSMATGGLALQNLASFVWGRGGSFRSPDYRRLALTEPAALRGISDYFHLHRFIDPAASVLEAGPADDRFYSGQAAVLFSGQWVVQRVKTNSEIPAEVVENCSHALPPGVPYLGGTQLVVWRHSLNDQEAVRLIDHLTSPAVLESIFHASGTFPARRAVLDSAPFSADPDYRLVGECLRRGRSMRAGRMWAAVESRLSALCDQLWSDIFAMPGLNLDAEIEKRVRDLAARLERTILANM